MSSGNGAERTRENGYGYPVASLSWPHSPPPPDGLGCRAYRPPQPVLRAEGRVLRGTVLRYGDYSPSHNETFAPGAMSIPGPVTLNLEHRRLETVAYSPRGGLRLITSPRGIQMRAEVPETPAGDAALQGVRTGALGGLSVEFFPRETRRKDGVRVIERADLVGVGLVGSPSYPQSDNVENRRRIGAVTGGIPLRRRVDCRCRFTGRRAARTAIVNRITVTPNLLAYLSDVKRVVGRARTEVVGADVNVTVTLDDALIAAREVAALSRLGVPMAFRPFPDFDASDWETSEDGLLDVYRRLVVAAWILIPGALAGDLPTADVEDG